MAPSRKRFQTPKIISKVLCQSGVTGNFLTVATSAPTPSKPCLPCADCPLTQTPAACASPGTQRGFCLEATCGINLSFSATATRNPLTLKIKRELCNLTLKTLCPFFFFLKTASSSFQKQPNQSYRGPLPTQTHCFPPGRLQASPWSLRGGQWGQSAKCCL